MQPRKSKIMSYGGEWRHSLFVGEARPKRMLVNVASPRSEACTRALADEHGYAMHAFVPAAAVAASGDVVAKHVVLEDTRPGSWEGAVEELA